MCFIVAARAITAGPKRCRLALVLLLPAAIEIAGFGMHSVARAQEAGPSVESVQPNALSLGIVRLGATVEASVRVFIPGDNTAGLAVDVTPPPFVKVEEAKLGTQTYGARDSKVFCDVNVSIDTSAVGVRSGPIKIKLGDRHATVPADVTIMQKDDASTRVLLIETPFQKYSTGDGAAFKPWLEVVKAANLDVSYLTVQRGQPVMRDLELARFDVLFLAGAGLLELGEADLKRLREFLDQGGRLVLAANFFYRGTVDKVNQVLDGFGMKMEDVEQPNGTFEVAADDVARDPLTGGVQSLKFYRASPITILEPLAAKILVVAPPHPDKGFVAVARSGKAEIVVLGQSLWWWWINDTEHGGADAGRLLQNVMTKNGR